MVHIEATRYETQKVPTMIQMQFKVTISLYSPNKRARSLSTLFAAIVSKETPHNAERMMFIGEHDELCIAVYFKCFNLEGKKNSTTNCEKEIPQRGNIESQYQNKPTYWTAGKRARARHYSLLVRTPAMMALRARCHFNPRVPWGTKILISFSFDANFYSNLIFFIFDVQFFFLVQIQLPDILKKWFNHWKMRLLHQFLLWESFFLSKLPSNPLW